MIIYVINEGRFSSYNEASKYQKKIGQGYIFACKEGYTIRRQTFYSREKAFDCYDKILDKKTFWIEEIKK